MGYNAEYKIKMNGNDIGSNQQLCEIMNGAIGIDLSDETYLKWYSEEKDMKKFSSMFPQAVFQLDAIGENGERWRNYYKNGDMEHAKIVTTYSECTL